MSHEIFMIARDWRVIEKNVPFLCCLIRTEAGDNNNRLNNVDMTTAIMRYYGTGPA